MIRFVVGPDGALVPDLAATAARPGNVVERVGGCDRSRPREGSLDACLRQGRARAGRRCPPIFLPCLRRRWSGGSASCWAWPGAPGRRSPGSRRRGSGCGPAGRGWWCRRRTAAPRSVRGSCRARRDGAGAGPFAGRGAGARVRAGPRGACGDCAGTAGRAARHRGGAAGTDCDGEDAGRATAARDTAGRRSGCQRVKHERKQRSGRRQGPALSAPGGTAGAGPDRRCRLRAAELQPRPLEGGAGGGAQEARRRSAAPAHRRRRPPARRRAPQLRGAPRRAGPSAAPAPAAR